MGGNFRIQSPADAAQIEYNLDHLRVAWGRVAMPLDRWQPSEDVDPVEAATTNTLNTSVREAMEMAQKLARKNIPTIISIWSAPGWALAAGGGGRGGRARINPEKWDKVCKSIGSYLEYMKKNYGAEPVLFSFNESDMGINVLQSPQEHAEAIKRLGAYFVSRGLKTRMLLGDTGNPTGDRFIDAALADAEAAKYIGAVSFHSWNSGTTAQYTHFSQAARQARRALAGGRRRPRSQRAPVSGHLPGTLVLPQRNRPVRRDLPRSPAAVHSCIGNSRRIIQSSPAGTAASRWNPRSDSGTSNNSA